MSLFDLPGLAAAIDRATLPRGPEFPESYVDPPEFVPCCYDSVHDGLRGCTCWEPVFDLEQSPDRQEGPAELATKCCADCAYRVGSPEREQGDLEQLEDIAHDHLKVFLCHQGVRRIIGWRHPILNVVVPAGPGDYRPPQGADRIWRADGMPGVLCAGWGAIGDRR